MDENEQGEYIPHTTVGSSLARPDDLLPETIQIIPVTARPFFPVLVQPVVLEKEPWGTGLERVAQRDRQLLGLSYASPGEGIPSTDQIRDMGCVIRMHRVMEVKDQIQFIAQGIRRFRIREWIRKEPPYVARVEYFRDPEVTPDEENQLRAYAMSLIDIIKELMTLNPLYNEELKQYLSHFSTTDPSPLADFGAAITSADPVELQEILETVALMPRMEKVLMLLTKELEVVRLQAQINEQIQEEVGDQQREFFLRQQLRVIQQELGISKDDRESDAEKFTTRLAPMDVPVHVRERIDDELEKLQVLEPSSAEYGVTRNYLDWVTSVPWGIVSDDNLDLEHARGVLDSDHFGLDDVKQRIIEFLAVGAYRGEIAGSIMTLVGPPGVGKTSIGQSVANALGRKFYRFSLGGMRDEAEIKGHRRTYIGAMPGKLIQALKEVEVANPVIMLDEIDKIGASYQGDPASALLEVLDPEQNSDFLDHYLDLRVDLSQVLFICTANQLDTIPAPLLDRMEVIRLAGYLAEEKRQIAKKHLWPKQLERAGLRRGKLKLADAALKKIVEDYAREAGVRALDKQLSKIVRRAVVNILADDKPVTVVAKNVPEYLGPPLYKQESPQRGVGVVNGLAWTSLGGTTLAIEASQIHGHQRGFVQTGQLGDVMRESSHIAYSYVMSHLKALNASEGFFDEAHVHLHVPEGATPKDGPSAGVTMATALLSLALNRQVQRPIAMTGELTLTGRVLPVGGIKEKVIAAKRAGFKELILPIDNKGDFDEIPDGIRAGLNVHFASDYTEVAAFCFALVKSKR
ncbi:MAG: endopeptidase La [Pseudomonadota bacterium]|nr:endopeptidase La [Pseudomonadota bacterium]